MGSGGSGMHTGSLSGPLETWQRAERLNVTRGAVSLVAAAPLHAGPQARSPGSALGPGNVPLCFLVWLPSLTGS